MAKWTTIKVRDVETSIYVGPHKWNKRIFHWAYCGMCGIVAVNNQPTRVLCKKLCGTFWN